MTPYTQAELQESLRPIASLISKSEKAQQQLTPGSWQHTMLSENINALHIASALMSTDPPPPFTRNDLQSAQHACAAMIRKVEHVQTSFAPGSSQHSLQHNRLKALRLAAAVLQQALEKSEG